MLMEHLLLGRTFLVWVSIYILVFSNNLRDFGHVGLPCLGVSSLVVAQRSILACGDPTWETTTSVFGINVRSRTEENIKADFFGKFEESFEVMGAGFEIQGAFCCTVIGCKMLVYDERILK